MKTLFKWLFVTVHILLHTIHIEQCAGDVHRINSVFNNNALYSSTFLERILFTRNTTIPKSYVVGFKYVSDVFDRIISHGSIESDARNTWGGGDISTGSGIHDIRSMNANIHIPNATKFEVDVKMSGMLGMGYSGMERWLRGKTFLSRSFALICAISEEKPRTQYHELIFGERNDGDAILYAQTESFASLNNKLPRHNIEFEDSSAILTAASIRLNSTAAIVFHNKIQLTDHRFSATIYGLNRDKIAYVVIIYGRRN